MSKTARDIITASLRKLGVVGRGMSLNPDDAADGLEALNNMLNLWSIQSLTIPVISSEDFNLVSAKASYSIGAGQDLDTVLPTEIEFAEIVDNQGNTYGIEVVTLQKWLNINDYSSPGRPCKLYFERTSTTGTVNLYPTPENVEALRIHTLKPLTTFSGLSIEHGFPEEYTMPLTYNLAVILADEYGKAVSANIRDLAESSLRSLKMHNFTPIEASADEALLRIGSNRCSYNINQG